MIYQLTAQNIAKSYNRSPVVKDVSLEVKSGQIVGLLGPNGAGKTTTFYMLVGIVKPDNGSIMIDNQDVTCLPVHHRARLGLGYLPQESSVFRGLTVEQNIKAILELRKELTKQQQLETYDFLIDEFRISHITSNIGAGLSGGERRRVEIARALAANPKFILLDEPFAGVDPISVKDIKRNIEQLKAIGVGVLITDHNVRETLDVCEKAYVVSNGIIVSSGTPKEILADPIVQQEYIPDDFIY